MAFSVLMSLYCKEKPAYLQACLESLCTQTLPADEIIMVFDGVLPEELESVVQHYQSLLPIHIVRLSHNMGLGRALNHGLQHCSYPWVCRMDTDDIALPDRFEKQINYLTTHPDTILVGGQIAEFDIHPQQIQHHRRVPQSYHDIIRFARWRNPFNHMTVAYSKEAVLAVGAYQHHQGMEDYNLWLRLLATQKICINLADTLVLARTGQAMLARRRGWDYVVSEWQLFCLKKKLHFQAALPAFYCFLIRSLPRLFPVSLLNFIYLRLRQK